MKVIKISAVEDILLLNDNIKKIEIDADVVIRYLCENKDNHETQINISELRNAYAKSVSKSYAQKRYNDNISISMGDLKKICYN